MGAATLPDKLDRGVVSSHWPGSRRLVWMIYGAIIFMVLSQAVSQLHLGCLQAIHMVGSVYDEALPVWFHVAQSNV